MDRVVVTKSVLGACHMQVCAVASASDEEILQACNRLNPSGTSLGWTTVHRVDSEHWGKVRPVVCASDASRLHFIIGC